MPTAKTPASRAGLRSSTTPPVSRVMPGWRSRTSDAPPISSGTSCSNTRAGVDSSSAAPAAPPTAVMSARRRSRSACPASSVREKLAALREYRTRATVLVTFAVSAGSPTASSAGYDTSDASPATDPATPATTPAITRRTMSAPCTGRILRRRRFHGGVGVGADTVAARFLGGVEGAVGPGDQGGRVLAAVPPGNPEGAGALGLGGAEALGDLHGVVQPAVGEQDGELLAAVAGHHVGPADHGLPGGGRLLEEPVPGLVAVAVVVGLEVVEVEQGHAHRLPGPGRPGQLPRQLLVPGPPVRHPGEAVGPGQPPHLPVQGPDLGQQPPQRPQQDAGRDPDEQDQRRRERLLGQHRVPRQRRVAQHEAASEGGAPVLPQVRAFGTEPGWVAGHQAGRTDLLVVQLDAGRVPEGRGLHRRLEEVAGPELTRGPAEEPLPAFRDIAERSVGVIDGHDQLVGDRSLRPGEVPVLVEGGLAADDRLPGVAGTLQTGQDPRDRAGVLADPRPGRIAVPGDVVDVPAARRPDGEVLVILGAGGGFVAGRLVPPDHLAPADVLQTRIAGLPVETPHEDLELLLVHLPDASQRERAARSAFS